MRTEAIALYWMGRLEVILLVMLLVTALVIWRSWRGSALPKLAAGWLILSIILLVTLFYNITFQRATNGSGYVWAHLFEGIWRSDEEALFNMLLRWRNVWFPAYLPWLGTWLIGLLTIILLSRKGRQQA